MDPKTIELTFWEAIKDSKSPDDFAAYLEKYPNGDFAGLARIRVKQLGATPARDRCRRRGDRCGEAENRHPISAPISS